MKLSFARTIAGEIPGMKLMTFSSSGATAKNEISTLTLPALAGATAGDHCIFYDSAGLSWGFALDVAGTDPEPTGALWVAVDAARKVNVDISAETTAAEVAAAVEVAIGALTDFAATFTTDDTAADGTMLLSVDLDGAVTDIEVYDEDESGAGSIAAVVTQAGAAMGSALGAGIYDGVLTGTDTEGDYTITFNEPLATAPQVAVSTITDDRIARIVTASTTLVRIQTETLAGAAADSDWHMLVVGGV